jgi:hypothetical protein
MQRKMFICIGILAAGTIGGSLAGQSRTPAQTKGYKPPRTPWGDPDLQGHWPGSVNIPLQRPASMGTRSTLTEQEFAARDAAERKRVADGHWIEYYPASHQASLVVDPPDGRIPPMTPEATKRNKEVRDGLGPPSLGGVEQRADSWEDFDLWGRCITKGLIGSMLPGNLYNKGNQILQVPGYFVIRNEMVHETRVIPLDGRPHAGSGVRMYMGDGRGHWEGDTLVVDTSNYKPRAFMSISSGKLHVTERFTRTGPEMLRYEITIDDPDVWTKPWSLMIPLRRSSLPVYEYACHEGNEGLAGILAGARAQEAAAAKAR